MTRAILPPLSGGRQSGFTLLEVLIAVAVLGLLIVGLHQGVRTGLALRHKQVEQLDRTADLDSAMRLLRRLLTRVAAAPQGRARGSVAEGAVFSGLSDSLTFVGDLPNGLGRSRRADMTLFVRGGTLLLSWSPRRHERLFGAPQPPAETELLHGVARLELAYWGEPSPDAAPGWQSRWEGPGAPELVRIRLVFPEKDRRQWPALLIETRA